MISDLLFKTLEQILFEAQTSLKCDLRMFEGDQDTTLLKIFEKQSQGLEKSLQSRLYEELFGIGPLGPLLEDPEVTEILVNGPFEIWYEIKGRLVPFSDPFLSVLTFQNFLHRLNQEVQTEITLENPFCDGHWRGHRLHLCGAPVTASTHISIRKHKTQAWTLEELLKKNWGSQDEITHLTSLIQQRKNILVIGPTGSGKTSVLNACLQTLEPNERCLILEDANEIHLPNLVSTKLLTRFDSKGLQKDIPLSDLLKQSLRMRPDRLIIGEVRGPEAKDLLMALATGHNGSFGTLHARDAQEALIRLEMLVQLGAPQWSLQAVRQLISLSIDYIVVVKKFPDGHRSLEGIYRISSHEDFGVLTERLDHFKLIN